MRLIHKQYILLAFAVVLFGCVPVASPFTPAWAETRQPSLPPVSPTSTFTLTPHPTQTATLTPPATLEPKQAKDVIRALLQGLVDCVAPCFWGIIPGQTTLGETKNIFLKLGLNLEFMTTEANKKFYGATYDFDNGLRITPVLTTQDNIVRNIRIGIVPEAQKPGVLREWSAYSPETLINRYGPPAVVSFSTDWGPRPFFDMIMYFESVDLIVEYSGYIVSGGIGFPHFCPLTDQFDSVHIWMGQDPQFPPFEGIPLEKATAMTIKEFSQLMTIPSNKACFDLKKEVFP